jgi:hypothetical protein
MRTYLVGAMDRVPDGGIQWRDHITPMLKQMNINVLNPCKQPVESVKEDDNTRQKIEHYKKTGQFEEIRKNFGHIRNADLRCVDVSDFIIAQIDMDVHMCGSYEEIVTANRQKKPILVWCKQGKHLAPNWLFFMIPHEHIFSNLEDLMLYLSSLNTSQDVSIYKRWFFFEGYNHD